MWRVTFDAGVDANDPLCGQRPTTPSRSCAPAWDCETCACGVDTLVLDSGNAR